MPRQQPSAIQLRFRIRTALLVVAATAVVLSIPSCFVTAWQTLQDTTYYSPGYSEWNFRSIRLGMHESEVIRLLGQPLETHSADVQTSWYYGPPTLRVTDDGGLWDTTGTFDTSRSYTDITANQDGRVVNVSGGFLRVRPDSLVGQRLSDVRKQFGEPHFVLEQRSSKYLVYSGTKESGSYYTRKIGLDAEGRVNNIVAGWYQD